MAAVDPVAFFSKSGKDGVSVRSHLAELIHKLLISKDADALAKLESLSLEVKQAHFDAAQPGSKETPSEGAVSVLKEKVPTEPWLKAAKALQSSVDPETSSLPWTAELPDQMPLFSGAGVGLSKQETYRTFLAMQKLQEQYGLTNVRFFGKIFGTKADYVIIEGMGPHKEASSPGATPPEAPGVGLNTATYFVAPSAVDEFVQLEDVTPEAVLAAMKIRKYLTGDLSAPVYCFPTFPGNEAALLRAQIARIAQATAVKPAGALVIDEESGAMAANPEYAPPETLPAADSWVHGYGGILKIGRCTNVPKVVVEGEEEAEGEELEEEVEALKSISEDPPVASYAYGEEPIELPAWSSKMYGTEVPGYGVAIAKSNRWPGAYAAIAKSGDKSACVYLGWGMENAGAAFTLAPFPAVLDESAESEEADEVTVDAENALFKEIDEAKNAAFNADGEAAEE